jgi:hypothetical protein
LVSFSRSFPQLSGNNGKSSGLPFFFCEQVMITFPNLLVTKRGDAALRASVMHV